MPRGRKPSPRRASVRALPGSPPEPHDEPEPGGGTLLASRSHGGRCPLNETSTVHPLEPVRATFLALAETFVPEVAELDEAERARVLQVAESGLRLRPAEVSRKVTLFVRILDGLARMRHGRGLAKLAPARRTRLIESIQDSPLPPFRRGVWGLRTLAFMGYYTREDVRRAIGYRADPRGWEARR